MSGHQPRSGSGEMTPQELANYEAETLRLARIKATLERTAFGSIEGIVRAKYPKGLDFRTFERDQELMETMAKAFATGLRDIRSLEMPEGDKRKFITESARDGLGEIYDLLKASRLIENKPLRDVIAEWAWIAKTMRFTTAVLAEMVLANDEVDETQQVLGNASEEVRIVLES